MEDLGEEEAAAPPSPAQAATDDVLLLVFQALAGGFAWPAATAPSSAKAAAARFAWFRTALPLVCARWQRLVLGTPGLWSCLIISPAVEAHLVRRSGRQQLQQPPSSSDLTSDGALAGASPPPKGPMLSGSHPHPYQQQHYAGAGGGLERSYSGSSTPNRGASPVMGSSPDSESGSYWASQYAPPGASPRHISQRLSRLSAHPPRASLSAHAVITWLGSHAAAAGGVASLAIHLGHHLGCHDFDRASLDGLLQQLPQLTRVHMAGTVEGTDAYESLAHLRKLRVLELSSASAPCLDGGLLGLCFLPHLASLDISLDIPPALPQVLADIPTGLQSLRLGAMWLEEMPPQLAECAGLARVVLERCQIEQNPLPLLLTLPSLASLTVRTASRGSSDASLPLLLPMQRPQQQRRTQPHARPSRRSGGAAAAANGDSGGGGGGGGDSSTAASSSSSSRGCVNTSITSLSLVDVGLRQLPPCISQLVALQELHLELNHDMGLNPTSCLPQELTSLSGLQCLCLGSCGLSQLPPVVADLTSLTRLELQGNTLSEAGFSPNLSPGNNGSMDVGFSSSLRVLDLTAQSSGRHKMRGIPAWVGHCIALTELRLGCSCLGYGSSSSGAVVPGAPGGQRGLPHSSSDVGVGGARSLHHSTSSGRQGPHHPAAARCLSLGSAASAPAGALSAPDPAGAVAAVPPVAYALPLTLPLQQLPALLPRLQLLVLEGGQWEQRAVRDALQLVRQLVRSGSSLQLVLPQ